MKFNEHEHENIELHNMGNGKEGTENIATKCNKCGYVNKEGARFCNQCGSEIKRNYNIENHTEINPTYGEVSKNRRLFKISKKMKVVIGIFLLIILTGCMGGYLYYYNYKYTTGYNLTDDEKIKNINGNLAKGNYEDAKVLANTYFSDDTFVLNSYIDKINLCEVYEISSLGNITEDDKRNSINEQLAEKNYDRAEGLVLHYFDDETSTKNNYFEQVELCRKNNLTSLDEGEKIQEENKLKAEENKRKAEEDLRKAEENLRKIQEEGRKLDEEIAKRNNIGVSELPWKNADTTPNIEKVNPYIGMTKDEALKSTWGKPKDINKTTTKYGTDEQWVYNGNKYLYFENGILTTIQN